MDNLDFILQELIAKKPEHRNIQLPVLKDEKRKLMRALMNIFPPQDYSDDFLKTQEEELLLQIQEKGVAEISETASTKLHSRIKLWQGDITRLKVDGIVNAANNQLLGCFIPLHACIDNAIHSAAGVQLRNECQHIVQQRGKPENTGKAKITGGYNLPAKHVIHTVSLIIIRKYCFSDLYSSSFYPFETEEERWAYWAKHISLNRYETPATKLYIDLLKLVPHCPVCGGKMDVNLRKDHHLVEDENWKLASKGYSSFLKKAAEGKTVLLELGVGFNTPGVIRYPFERMIYQNQAQTLIRFNKNHADGPEENRDRTISFSEEMNLVITDLKTTNNARYMEPMAWVH